MKKSPDLTNTIKLVLNITSGGKSRQVITFVERTAHMAAYEINLDKDTNKLMTEIQKG